MECVLTLIASARAPLDDALVSAARDALHERHATVSPPDWLAPAEACDVAFSDLDPDMADAAVRARLGDAPVDVVCQPVADRRKMLLVADMDSTIVTAETLDELAAFAGLKNEIAAITSRAMRGELDFESALRERVSMLKGLEAEALAKTFAEIEYTGGARALVQTMRANGAHCMLVSGGFTYFTDRVAAHCGFHEAHANTLGMDGDRLDGTVGEPILGRDAKLRALMDNAGTRHLPLTRTCAVGDGANDVAMLQAAGLGVAFHAKPMVQDMVRVKINHGDLTALLYAQGYRKAEFAA
jgi:phosphoserine phosphatase